MRHCEFYKNITVISGVAGMTGSLIAYRLLEKEHLVIGFDNFFAGSRQVIEDLRNHRDFHFFEYDINDANCMNTLFAFTQEKSSNNKAELAFINCAAVVHTKHFYHPDETFRTNVISMRDTLSRTINTKFSKYINCSSSEVYSLSSWTEGGVCENQPVLLATAEQSLRTSYATGKLLTEFFMQDAVNNNFIKGCSIRFANVYSPLEAHEEHIIPYILSSLIRNKHVVLLENAKMTYRSFIHNSDSCDAVISLLETEKALDGSVYNVGSNEEICIVDLVHKIAKMLGIDEIVIEYLGQRTADPLRRLLNTDKIRKAAKWVAKISLDEGLMQCVKLRYRG